jgi:hypothetical protein
MGVRLRVMFLKQIFFESSDREVYCSFVRNAQVSRIRRRIGILVEMNTGHRDRIASFVILGFLINYIFTFI